jgi:hypothetical protein
MRVDIWCSVVQNPDVAPPATITIDTIVPDGELVRGPDLQIKAVERDGALSFSHNVDPKQPLRKPKETFLKALGRACEVTRRQFGWPQKVGFVIGIRSIDPEAFPLPALEGNSHYGALVLALAQAVALSEPECIKTGSATPLHILRSVFLQSVAVETACDDNNPNEDSFMAVGMLPAKLAGFCLHGIESPPAICLVSPGQQLFPPDRQDISERFDVSKGQEKYVPGNGRTPLPIYRVDHVHEAFRLLWDAQIRTLGRYV